MNKILVPVDFSELSKYALNLANQIALGAKAELHVLNIVPVEKSALFDKEGNLSDSNDFDVSYYNKIKESNIKKMEEFVEGITYASTMVKIGDIEETILKTESSMNFDLIVMGTHGSVGMDELISGSISDKIIRLANASVITMKCQRDAKEFKKVILASDFARAEKDNIDQLRTIIKVLNAELHLLKVNTTWNKENFEEVEKRMKAYCEVNDLSPSGCHIIEADSVEAGITRFMGEQEIEFVAIGSKGRMGISAFFNGCVSADLVNHLYAPVFTFRA
jgi:nucleotide-binding universal stress UspA family protein